MKLSFPKAGATVENPRVPLLRRTWQCTFTVHNSRGRQTGEPPCAAVYKLFGAQRPIQQVSGGVARGGGRRLVFRACRGDRGFPLKRAECDAQVTNRPRFRHAPHTDCEQTTHERRTAPSTFVHSFYLSVYTNQREGCQPAGRAVAKQGNVERHPCHTFQRYTG